MEEIQKVRQEQRDQMLCLLKTTDNTKSVINYLSNITILDLSHVQLNLNMMGRLIDALKSNTSLHYLDLSSNILNAQGIQALCEALKENRTLHRLNLSLNQFGIQGAQYLSEALKANITLQSLDLSGNSLNTESIRYLSEALKVNKTLKNLDLSHNKIDIKGLQHLIEALKAHITLQNLDLQYNDLSLSDAKLLSDAIQNITNRLMNKNSIQITYYHQHTLVEAFKDHKQYMTQQAHTVGNALKATQLPLPLASLINDYLAKDNSMFFLKKVFDAGFSYGIESPHRKVKYNEHNEYERKAAFDHRHNSKTDINHFK